MSVCHPTHQSHAPSVRLSVSSDHLYTILPCLSDHPSLPDHLYDDPMSLSACPSSSDSLYDKPTSLSACPSPSDSLTATLTYPTVCLSSHTIHRTQDSSQSLAVVNGEQSHKAKKFRRAFTNYNLPLHALDVSSIYLGDSRHVAPPKSGEDAHVTCGRCDLGGTALNKPR